MQTLFSIILPLLAIRLFLNPVPTLSLSSSNPPPHTATAQYSYLNHISLSAFSLVFIRRSSSPYMMRESIRHQHPSKYSFHSSSLWRCRNQSRSKLPLLSSPTQVLERKMYSLLSQYPVSVKCQKLHCVD